MHNVIVSHLGLAVFSNINLLLQLSVRKFTGLNIQFTQLVVLDVSLLELLLHFRRAQYTGI